MKYAYRNVHREATLRKLSDRRTEAHLTLISLVALRLLYFYCSLNKQKHRYELHRINHIPAQKLSLMQAVWIVETVAHQNVSQTIKERSSEDRTPEEVLEETLERSAIRIQSDIDYLKEKVIVASEVDYFLRKWWQ